jgi:PST family polysaccharide transporter
MLARAAPRMTTIQSQVTDDTAALTYDAGESLEKKVFEGGYWLGMTALLQSGLHLVVIAMLGRLLQPVDFGRAAVVAIVIDITAGIGALGISQALVQGLTLTPRRTRVAFTLSVLAGTLCTATLYSAADAIAVLIGSSDAGALIRAASWVFVLKSLGVVSESLAARRGAFHLLAIRHVAGYVLGFGVVGTVAALLGAGAWALILAQLVEAACTTLLLVTSVPFDPRPAFDLSDARRLLSFGSGTTVARIVNTASMQVVRISVWLLIWDVRLVV